MNLPNLLTLSRIPFLFIIAALLYWKFPFSNSIACLVFGIAGLTDWLDGKIAREMGIVSIFGQLMDALTDKILTVGLFVVFLELDLLKDWMLFLVLLILSREFLITGLRMVAAAKNTVLAAEKAGKLKTVFQIIAISAILVADAAKVDWLPIFGDGFQWFVSFAFIVGWALFCIAAAMTVSSGTGYMIKYWNLFFKDDEVSEQK